jgi:hypothetical protein
MKEAMWGPESGRGALPAAEGRGRYFVSRKRVTTDGKRMTCCGRIIWSKRGVLRKDCTMVKFE